MNNTFIAMKKYVRYALLLICLGQLAVTTSSCDEDEVDLVNNIIDIVTSEDEEDKGAGWEECKACEGSTKCRVCKGTGRDEKNYIGGGLCNVCLGNGLCQACDGVGGTYTPSNK